MAAVSFAYDYDANDFVVGINDYNEGTGIIPDRFYDANLFNDPCCVLGRPTIDTTGDGVVAPPWEPMVVCPVFPSFRSYELVTVGNNGHLIVEFNHPVRDDKNNPYGIDFIIFGNTPASIDVQSSGGDPNWYQNSDPNDFFIAGGGWAEPGGVSISQDGIIWYDYNDVNSPMADSFAPTLGRVYDPNNPDPNAFTGNLYWGEPTNPTIPVDPNLSFADFVDKSLSQICNVYYGQSAGGTGFDINEVNLPVDPCTGLKWFQYVKIEDADGSLSTEVDAVSDVSCCGDYKHPFPDGDLSEDCKVNLEDFGLFAGYWLAVINGPDDPARIADIEPDDFVDFNDLKIIAGNWLDCNWDCD